MKEKLKPLVNIQQRAFFDENAKDTIFFYPKDQAHFSYSPIRDSSGYLLSYLPLCQEAIEFFEYNRYELSSKIIEAINKTIEERNNQPDILPVLLNFQTMHKEHVSFNKDGTVHISELIKETLYNGMMEELKRLNVYLTGRDNIFKQTVPIIQALIKTTNIEQLIDCYFTKSVYVKYLKELNSYKLYDYRYDTCVNVREFNYYSRIYPYERLRPAFPNIQDKIHNHFLLLRDLIVNGNLLILLPFVFAQIKETLKLNIDAVENKKFLVDSIEIKDIEKLIKQNKYAAAFASIERYFKLLIYYNHSMTFVDLIRYGLFIPHFGPKPIKEDRFKTVNRSTFKIIFKYYFDISSFSDTYEWLKKVVYALSYLLIRIREIECLEMLYSIDKEVFDIDLSAELLRLYINKRNGVKIQELIDRINYLDRYHPIIKEAKAELQRIHSLEKIKKATNINFNDVNDLDGIQFEQLVKDKLIEMGFKVEPTKATSDFGADLIVETETGTRVAVQCKRFKAKVNLKAVQEIVASLNHYGCDMGIVITNSSFFQSAVKLAESNNIELWDGSDFLRFMDNDLSFSKITEA